MRVAVAVGRIRRRIQLDQYVIGSHTVSIGNSDPFHHADLERLDELDLARRNDPPVGGGDDVDVAERRPENADDQQQSDRGHHDPACRRHGRFDDLQRRREKFTLRRQPTWRPTDRQLHRPFGRRHFSQVERHATASFPA